MKLSIIIVNYNVKFFLEQCLFSVLKAIGEERQPGQKETYNANLKRADAEQQSAKNNQDPGIEVIVVDNASTDGSIAYLQPKFPFVRFIGNIENKGFARANNQALKIASGEYVLFLNPDTILPENILCNCISFFESHAEAGAVGVQMMDGGGRFLAESKRGDPTAWRSFCKLSGLSALFPSSKLFAGYNLGNLNQRQVHEVDALAGAFMMVNKKLIDKTGGFDERFFMYAEDIDLSRRIRDLGYKNYYLGNEMIIHFKGESTRRSVKQLKLFYGAMVQYVEKHSTRSSKLTAGVLKAGIWIRAAMALVSIPLHRPEKFRLGTIRFFGDHISIDLLKDRLINRALFFREEPQAETIVLCEGDNFSFTELIEAIKNLPSGNSAMIHAAGSDSVIGSFDKEQKGTTIALTSS